MSITVKYGRSHKSINRFNEVQLPDFTVLTGKNGSGKSHFLEAISLERARVEGSSREQIVYFDALSFFLDNELPLSLNEERSHRDSTWNTYTQFLKARVEKAQDELLSTPGSETIKSIMASENVGLMNVHEFTQDEALLGPLETYRLAIHKSFRESQEKSNDFLETALLPYVKDLRGSRDERQKVHFDDHFRQNYLKSNFLPNRLGGYFWHYYVLLRKNRMSRQQNDEDGLARPTLSEAEFVSRYGPPPWELLNEILRKFETLEYEIVSPANVSPFEGTYYAKLRHKTLGFQIEFSDLSSGEKILMALVATLYKGVTDQTYPSLLLLDEIDASLHPSMITNLFDVIETVFLKRGTKVMLVTHSATTIALAPEDSIFVAVKGDEDFIQKRPKSEALSILTEGYATLGESLKLIDEIAKSEITVITEGYNVRYIKRALELLAPELLPKVELVDSIIGKSGKNQLKQVCSFLVAVKPKRPVLFVLDCDVQDEFEESNTVHVLRLPKYEEIGRIKKGVENMFPISAYREEDKVSRANDQGGITQVVDKDLLKTRLLKEGTATDFVNFQLIITAIKNSLSY